MINYWNHFYKCEDNFFLQGNGKEEANEEEVQDGGQDT